MEEVKKVKKQTEPCVYGEKAPTNVNQLNDNYIFDYVNAKLADGSITEAKVSEYLDRVEKENLSPIKQRHLFAEMFMPEIMKKEKATLIQRLNGLINK